MTKSPSAAALRRRSTIAHGFRLSESDMAQKSWPSGAPSRAAAACIAETPGDHGDVERAPAGSSSIASNNAAAIAKTPGSPPETTATSRPSPARRERKPGAGEFVAIVARMARAVRSRSASRVDIGRIADDVGCGCDRGGGLGRHPSAGPGPSPTIAEPVRSRPPAPAWHEDHREIGRGVVALGASGMTRSPSIVARST